MLTWLWLGIRCWPDVANVFVMLRIGRALEQMCEAANCTCVAALQTNDECAALQASLEALLLERSHEALVRTVASERLAQARSGKPASAITVEFSGATDGATRGSGVIRLPLRFKPAALDPIAS